MQRFSIVFLLCVFLVSAAGAQGRYMEDGLGLEGSIAEQDGTLSIGGQVGYVLTQGRVEFGAFIVRSENPDEPNAVVTTGFGPYLGVYVARQTEQNPISMRLGAAYSMYHFSGDVADALARQGLSLSGYAVSMDATLFSHFGSEAGPNFVPQVGLQVTTATVELGGGRRPSEPETENVVALSVGIGIHAGGGGGGTGFAVTPRLVIPTDGTPLSISLSISVLFGS